MEPPEILYERLRHLAVEDPLEARRAFLQLLDSGGPALDHFLGRISSSADGRLRQLVANAPRNDRDRERLAPHLIAWHEIETDEFTHRAIAGALKGLDTRSAAQTALALEVARLTTAIGREMAQRERLNRELEIAREVQEHLFPQRLPPVPGLDYCGRCRPAREIGGDYYDFLELPEASLSAFRRCRAWTTAGAAGRHERSAGTTTIFSSCPKPGSVSLSATFPARASAPRS